VSLRNQVSPVVQTREMVGTPPSQGGTQVQAQDLAGQNTVGAPNGPAFSR